MRFGFPLRNPSGDLGNLLNLLTREGSGRRIFNSQSPTAKFAAGELHLPFARVSLTQQVGTIASRVEPGTANDSD